MVDQDTVAHSYIVEVDISFSTSTIIFHRFQSVSLSHHFVEPPFGFIKTVTFCSSMFVKDSTAVRFDGEHVLKLTTDS